MFCRNCGNELKESDKFCNVCGTATGGNAEVPVAEKKKSVSPFLWLGIVLAVLLATIVGLLIVRVGKVNQQLDAMEAQKQYEQNMTQIQQQIDDVFEERTGSVIGNEELGSVCLNYVCHSMLEAGDEVAKERVGLKLESESITSLEEELFNTLMVYFENEENYNKVASAITARSSLDGYNIEIEEDMAHAYVTVHHIDVYDACLLTWEDILGEDSMVDILLAGETGILSQLAKLKKGDLSLFLDGFAENCALVENDSVYTDKVTFLKNEDGTWEIEKFPERLLHAYYGIPGVSPE